MRTHGNRLLAVSAATLALVVAGAAVVTAHHDERERGFGIRGGPLWGLEGRGDLGLGLGIRLRGLAGGAFDDFVRSETTIMADEGPLTQRVDQGTVSSVSEGSIDYTLATDEAASAATDEDTQVIAFTAQTVERGGLFGNGFSRERLVAEPIEMADIAAGSSVVVWATSQDDGSFLAQRIIVQPTVDETTSDEVAPESEASDEAATAETSSEAEPSPAPADA
jgi:hypothetical protein